MDFVGLLMHPHWTYDGSDNLLVFFFLSNSTREVEMKLTFKCVDKNTKWKIHVQVLSIQNVNFCSHAICTQTQFSCVCTYTFLLQSTANASKKLDFFRDSFL